MASYAASQQIPWLREQYAAALAAWAQNPTDTVRRLEMGMIAVVMMVSGLRAMCRMERLSITPVSLRNWKFISLRFR